MAANHTPLNSSSTSPTHWYSKPAFTSKTAKSGMCVPPLHTPGTTSKHISRMPNASYGTKCAQPNKPASTATLHTINHFQQPNPQPNIRKPSLTWHPPPPLIANSSPHSPLPLSPLTNTSTNSTQAPQTHHPLSKPTPTQPPPQQPCPLSPPPSPNYNNNSQHSKKKMRLSATVASDDPDPVTTTEITAGHMVIALETNTPVKRAKTNPRPPRPCHL